MVLSKLALVSLDYYKILSKRVKGKFELCEICQSCYQCKLKLNFIILNNSLWASSANLDRI